MSGGSHTLLARVTAREGTGTATGVAGEGNWIKQADLSAIACNVYDLSSSTPSTAVVTPTVTISTAIQDSPVTTSVLWTLDTTGYNFVYNLPTTAFPTDGHLYKTEVKFTLTSGTIGFAVYEGLATATYS